MDPKDQVAPVVEPKETAPAKSEAAVETPGTENTPAPKVETKKEETIGEALGTGKTEPVKAKEPKMVPESVLIEVKKELKELKRSIEAGSTTKVEVATDIKALAEKYGVDEAFLNELGTLMYSKSKADLEEEINQRLAPLQEQVTGKDREEKINKAFDRAYANAIKQAPEFEKIANKAVIKALSLDPKNAHKTFNQLIEEAYGHLVTGKRTLDPAGGGGRSETGVVDMARAKSDGDYFKQVMADPILKKQYNENLTGRLSSVL
jgi:hypothetical protein